MSLAEIADEMGITRAAVHDSLKSAEAKLEKYEEKLGLLTKYENKAELAARAVKIITESQQKSLNTHSGNNHDNTGSGDNHDNTDNHNNTDDGDSVLIDDASKKELLDIVEKLSEIR